MNIPDKRPKPKILEKFISGHFFRPQNELLPTEAADQIKLPVSEHKVNSGKAVINGWQIESANPKGRVVFFHGSTGTNKSWMLLFYYLYQSGYSIWSFDYAGYGKSTDTPTFSSFFYDVEIAMNYILENNKCKIDNTILYGHSLGCFAVQHLVNKFGIPNKIILQSPLFSLDVLLKGKSPAFLLNYYKIPTFSLEQLYQSNTHCHVLIGSEDTILPKAYGIELWTERQNTNLEIYPDYKHASFIKPNIELLDKIFKNN